MAHQQNQIDPHLINANFQLSIINIFPMGSTLFGGNKAPSSPIIQKLANRVILQKSDSAIPRSGLYIINPDIIEMYKSIAVALPLKNINYGIQIINHLVKVSLTQSYENSTDVFLETQYSFPVDPKIVVHQFRAKFQNVIISGEVKQKQQAKQEYKQALSEGRQVAYGEIDADSFDIMNLKVGNIPPKSIVTIEIEFIQELEVVMNTLYKLRIPSVISPRYINDKIQKEEPWYQSIAKYISPSQTELTYTWTFNLKLLSESPLVFNNSSTHDLLQTSVNPTQTEADFILSDKQIPNKDFVFVYSNKDMSSCTIGKNDTSISAAISFIPKYAELKADDAFKMMLKDEKYEMDIEKAAGEYIFILDRSGSMSGGRISKAVQALKIFMKSLPPKSLFNIISFGDSYSCMFESSVEYNDTNIKHALAQLCTYSADLGGTQIQAPLAYIFNKKVEKQYPRQIFLLTDGGVSNTNNVIKLVKNNVKYSRVHTIGVGNGCSVALIKGCAQKGKGKAVFITDEGDIASPVIELLTASLTPLITSFKLDYDASVVESIVPNPNSMPFILKDEPVNFYVIFKQGFSGKTFFNLKYTESVHNIPFENKIEVNSEVKELNFPFVDKIAQHKTISILVDKLNSKNLIEQDLLIAKISDLEKEIVRRSVKSQVLCPLTAFICVGKKLEDGKYLQFLSKGQQAVVISQHQSIDYQLPSSFAPLVQTLSYSPMSNSTSRNKMSYGMARQPLPQMRSMAMQKCMDICEMEQKMQLNECLAPRGVFFGTTSNQNSFDLLSGPVPTATTTTASTSLFSASNYNPPPPPVPCSVAPGANYFLGGSSTPPKNIIQPPKPQALLEYIISTQSFDGSWEASEELISRIFDTAYKKNAFAEIVHTSNLNKNLVVTIIILAWLSSKHNSPAYSLIIKKGKTWVSKKAAEVKLDEQGQQSIVAKLAMQ